MVMQSSIVVQARKEEVQQSVMIATDLMQKWPNSLGSLQSTLENCIRELKQHSKSHNTTALWKGWFNK